MNGSVNSERRPAPFILRVVGRPALAFLLAASAFVGQSPAAPQANQPTNARISADDSPLRALLPEEAYAGPAGCLPPFEDLRQFLLKDAEFLYATRSGRMYRLELRDRYPARSGGESDAGDSAGAARFLHWKPGDRRLEVCDAIRMQGPEEFRMCLGAPGLIYQDGAADSEMGDFLTLSRTDSEGRATRCSWTIAANRDLEKPRDGDGDNPPVYMHSYIWKCDGANPAEEGLAESFSRLEILHPERPYPAVRAPGRPILQQLPPERSWALNPASIAEEWQRGFYLETTLRALCNAGDVRANQADLRNQSNQ